MKKTITFAVAAFAATLPTSAQEATLSDSAVELYSEMWALAGICNQLANYDVDQDSLADRLNEDLGDLDDGYFAAVSAQRDTKLAAIRTNAEAVQQLPRGNRRQREVDAQAETLMTRCRHLADHSFAGTYFRSI